MDDVGDGDDADHFLVVVNHNQPGHDHDHDDSDDDDNPGDDDGDDPGDDDENDDDNDDDSDDPGDEDDNATDDGRAHLLTSALTSRSITSRTDSSPLETMMMIFVMITVIKMNDDDGDVHMRKK